MSAERIRCALRPDAQAFDEVRIVTVPRFKESGLSGDEWRISARVDLLRKGKVVASERYRNVETAAAMLSAFMFQAMDNGHGWFAGDGTRCDQEGCDTPAVVRLRKLKDFCREGHETVPHEPTFRHFCAQHRHRGDCGLDDADRNYVEEPMTS